MGIGAGSRKEGYLCGGEGGSVDFEGEMSKCKVNGLNSLGVRVSIVLDTWIPWE